MFYTSHTFVFTTITLTLSHTYAAFPNIHIFHTAIPAHTHMHIHTHSPTCLLTRRVIVIHTRALTHVHIPTHILIHTHSHTLTHSHNYVYTNIYKVPYSLI